MSRTVVFSVGYCQWEIQFISRGGSHFYIFNKFSAHKIKTNSNQKKLCRRKIRFKY